MKTATALVDLHGLNVDRSSPLPINAQMRQLLLHVIADRRQAGIDTFFTDEMISRQFGVSRMTARQAVGDLVREGLLYRRQGIGTFIAPLKVIEKEGPVGDFFGDWPTQGHRVDVEVPVFRHAACSEELATILQVLPGTVVLYFQRHRFSDGVPVALDDRWVAPPSSRHITREELRHRSIHHIVIPRIGLAIAKAQVEIEAGRSTAKQGELLEIEPGDPILIRTVTPYSSQGLPSWTGRSIYRSDLYKYSIQVNVP